MIGKHKEGHIFILKENSLFRAAFSYLLMTQMLFKSLEPFVCKEFRTDYLENFWP